MSEPSSPISPSAPSSPTPSSPTPSSSLASPTSPLHPSRGGSIGGDLSPLLDKTGTPPDTPPRHDPFRARTKSKALHRSGTTGILSPQRGSTGSLSQVQRRMSGRTLSPGLKRTGTMDRTHGSLGTGGSATLGSPLKPGAGVPLFHNVKEVRCEGWLSKKNTTGITGLRGWQRRYFILFPHSLCYWPNEKTARSKPPKGKWECTKITRVVQDDAKNDKRFDIFTADGRIIELKADTSEDAEFWVENLPGDKASAPKQSVEQLMAQLAKDQPSEDELNKQFEAFMEEKCFKSEARERMRQLPSKNKWMLLVQENAKSQGSHGGQGTEQYLRLLRAPKVNIKDVESLKVAISGSGKSWMNAFVQIGGLAALIALLSKDTSSGGLAAHALDCLKAFMNNEFGLNIILSTPAAVDQIALVLTFGDEAMCMQVIDLLLVTCWLSEEGHRSVLNALDNSRFRRRFEVLTQFLTRGDNVLFKSKTMTFVNVLINARDNLEERIATRQDFLDLGIQSIIEDLRAWVEKARGQAGFERYDQLRVQIDLFEEELTNDHRDSKHGVLDLADIDAVLSYIKENTTNTGFSSQFLTALHHLMVIPGEKYLGKKLWGNVNHILDYATQFIEEEDAEDEEEAYSFLSFERLKTLLTEREKQNVLEEKNQIHELEKEAEALRKELHEMHMKEQRDIDRIKDLENKLALAFSGQLAAPPGTVPAEGASGSTDASPPDAPPMDAPPDAPPMDDIPAAPDMDDVPPAPDMDGDGPPPAPDMEPVIKLKPKKKIKPAVKMKVLHWRVVEPKNVNNTVWKDLDDADITFDTKDFEEKFQKPTFSGGAKKAKGGDDGEQAGTPSGGDEEEKKKDLVLLLDPKRSYNVNISLARFRTTHQRIRDAILEMDEKLLDEERLESLLKVAPTPEETEQVNGYDGDENLLGDAEKFFRVISAIPRVSVRLELFLFKLRYEPTVLDLEQALLLCESTILALKTSRNLRRVFEVMLALGNYLNGGTKNGGAYGFRLDTITSFKNTKGSNESGINLLHFLVLTINKYFKDARNFVNDLKDIHGAARVELSFLTSETNKICGNVRKLERELTTPANSTKDRFYAVMAPFFKTAYDKGNELTERVKKVEQSAAALAEFFGEDAKSLPMSELFSVFSTFVSDYQKADLFLQKKEEAEERKRVRELAEKVKKPKGTLGKSPESSPGGLEDIKLKSTDGKNEPIVDKVVGALQGSAGSVRQMIRARRRKAGAGGPRGRRGSKVEAIEKEAIEKEAAGSRSASPAPGGADSLAAPKASPPVSSAKPAKKKKKPIWQAHTDPDSGETYYYNTRTGESVWDKPATFPY